MSEQIPMENALLELYSQPISDPRYWQFKSILGRMTRFTLPVVIQVLQETVHDYMEENVPLSEAFMENVVEHLTNKTINSKSTINEGNTASTEQNEQNDCPKKRARVI